MRVEGAVVLDLANLLLGQLAGDDVHHELAGDLLVHLGSGHVDRVVERPEEVRLPAHHRRPAIEDRLVLVLPIEAPDGLQVLFRDVLAPDLERVVDVGVAIEDRERLREPSGGLSGGRGRGGRFAHHPLRTWDRRRRP